MMQPTCNLRFVWRKATHDFKELSRILQQQWMDDDPPDEGAIKYEWRDVPCEDGVQEESRTEDDGTGDPLPPGWHQP